MEYNILTSSPLLACLASMDWAEPHASHFNAGSVTFVGNGSREYGGWVHIGCAACGVRCFRWRHITDESDG